MRRSIYHHTKAVVALTVATRSANTTVNGTGVDRVQSGTAFRSAMLVVHTGTITDGTHAFKLQDSDDNSSFADVAAAYLQGDNPSAGASNDDTVYELGYVGDRRYLRVAVTTSGATSGGVFGATIILGDPSSMPS